MDTIKPLNIVLYEPVIPQNTGAISRLCACTGAVLHLIYPLGFDVDEKAVRRAGLDYWEHVDIRHHSNWNAFLEKEEPENLFFFSKFATQTYEKIRFQPPTYIVFGSETTGLPPFLHEKCGSQFYKVPMRTHLVRSLNLAQCVAIVAYEALKQNDFVGALDPR